MRRVYQESTPTNPEYHKKHFFSTLSASTNHHDMHASYRTCTLFLQNESNTDHPGFRPFLAHRTQLYAINTSLSRHPWSESLRILEGYDRLQGLPRIWVPPPSLDTRELSAIPTRLLVPEATRAGVTSTQPPRVRPTAGHGQCNAQLILGGSGIIIISHVPDRANA